MAGQRTAIDYDREEDTRLGPMRVLVTATSVFAILGLVGGYIAAPDDATCNGLGNLVIGYDEPEMLDLGNGLSVSWSDGPHYFGEGIESIIIARDDEQSTASGGLK